MTDSDWISPKQSALLSDLAFAVLELPAAIREALSCRRLLCEAAMGRLRTRAAALTVLVIIADVLVVDEADANFEEALQ